jgi:large subunit ribosomal protein L32e
MADEEKKKGAAPPAKKEEAPKKAEHKPASNVEKAERAGRSEKAAPAKMEAKDEKKGEDEEEEEEIVRRPKPDLSHDELRLLKVRKDASSRRPIFRRQEASTHLRLYRRGWRKPRGGQSRRRQHEAHRVNVVSTGYRGPADVRGLHPSGFEEVLISSAGQLKGLDPKRQAVRISAGVSRRRRGDLEDAAEDLGLWVLNLKMEYYVVKVKDPSQIVELGLTAKGDKRRSGGDAVLIDPSVPDRVREDIIAEAEDRGLKVLNPGAGRT